MIAIIDYKAGNVRSVYNALMRLETETIISDKKSLIEKADKVIFPGVGHAQTAMMYLRERNLDQLIPNLQQPVLGICLGMQIMGIESEEGPTPTLGIIQSNVKRFPADFDLQVPHMGWNAVSFQNNTLFKGIALDSDFYFVHSYYMPINEWTIASCNYGIRFSAAIQSKNFVATQFHPEKSGKNGLIFLNNFLSA